MRLLLLRVLRKTLRILILGIFSGYLISCVILYINQEQMLFPNQFVNVRLLVEIRKDRILIPAVAIQRGPQGTYVYVIKEDQTADVRPVTVGTIEAAQASVESGLSEGERVVVDGVDKLRAGSKVKVNSEQGPAE